MSSHVSESRREPQILGQAVSSEFHAAFEEEYRLYNPRRGMWLRYLGVVLVTGIISSALTWAIASSRPVTVTLSAVDAAAQANIIPSAAPENTVVASDVNTGQVALTEAQLRVQVKAIGSSIYWAGSVANSLYTLNHIKSGQDFIRYLPDGKGLSDQSQNYRVIATYEDATAYATVTTAAKTNGGVSLTNPDGSFVYYSKATPTHVYLVFKNLPYQIEIFDPVPGASLKLATTPGIIGSI